MGDSARRQTRSIRSYPPPRGKSAHYRAAPRRLTTWRPCAISLVNQDARPAMGTRTSPCSAFERSPVDRRGCGKEAHHRVSAYDNTATYAGSKRPDRVSRRPTQYRPSRRPGRLANQSHPSSLLRFIRQANVPETVRPNPRRHLEILNRRPIQVADGHRNAAITSPHSHGHLSVVSLIGSATNFSPPSVVICARPSGYNPVKTHRRLKA